MKKYTLIKTGILNKPAKVGRQVIDFNNNLTQKELKELHKAGHTDFISETETKPVKKDSTKKKNDEHDKTNKDSK